MTTMKTLLALGMLVGGLADASFASVPDRDSDGVSDALEQALIERFRPQFWVDVDECAGAPAEFQADTAEPRVLAHNGAIYARVSPSTALSSQSAALIVSYYHLWDQDCGPLSPHPLDVEHVSALVVAPSRASHADDWVALYWYAAAHEDTICDTSNAARAEAIDAVTSGPSVWIAKGKHASYLNRTLCSQRGCGVDACREMIALPPGPLINLGEADAPADNAAWIASEKWPLTAKLSADFDPALMARLDASDETVLARVNGQWRAQHFSLSIGGDIVKALGKADGGLLEADEKTSNALDRSFLAVGRALGAAATFVGATLGYER
ncbi:MAG: hypothetical protein BMS9Abin37_1807 [Acidobacteriota bacterium]|nr:MAG: hypothetical protein BMS9Abin37_1807 [Acidobacteriota bacterium]